MGEHIFFKKLGAGYEIQHYSKIHSFTETFLFVIVFVIRNKSLLLFCSSSHTRHLGLGPKEK